MYDGYTLAPVRLAATITPLSVCLLMAPLLIGTLIAHEQCLLIWVETKEGEQTLNDLKCPQCGTKYEIESHKPLLYRVMSSLDGAMTFLGKKATIVTIAGVGGAFVSSAFPLLLLLPPPCDAHYLTRRLSCT